MKSLRNTFQAIVCASLVLAQSAHGQALDELIKAVEEGNVKRTAFYLDRGMDPNSSDPDGNTILMIAARLGHTELVSDLIARKASLTRQTKTGDTALMMACLGNHLDVVKMLVSAGAPVESGHGWQPLHYAAFGGSVDIVRYLLDKGAEKNALAPNSYTPLMLAVRESKLDTARALLLEDADTAHKGPKGETALSIAEQRGNADLVDLLKRAGAKN